MNTARQYKPLCDVFICYSHHSGRSTFLRYLRRDLTLSLQDELGWRLWQPSVFFDQVNIPDERILDADWRTLANSAIDQSLVFIAFVEQHLFGSVGCMHELARLERRMSSPGRIHPDIILIQAESLPDRLARGIPLSKEELMRVNPGIRGSRSRTDQVYTVYQNDHRAAMSVISGRTAVRLDWRQAMHSGREEEMANTLVARLARKIRKHTDSQGHSRL